MIENKISTTAGTFHIEEPAKKRKKKRPRIRNRKRNKCNRFLDSESATDLTETTTNSIADVILPTKDMDTETSTPPMEAQQKSSAKPQQLATKTREEIMAEREAKKLAKQAKKSKLTTETANATGTSVISTPPSVAFIDAIVKAENRPSNNNSNEKSRDQIKIEREAKKQAKLAAKAAKVARNDKVIAEITEELSEFHLNNDSKDDLPKGTTAESTAVSREEKKKPALTKAERRAIQEAQRAAKAQALNEKKAPAKKPSETVKATLKPVPIQTAITSPDDHIKLTSPVKSAPKVGHCKVKLFNHLDSMSKDVSLFINHAQIHPSVVRLGEQYASRTVVGSNSRCIAFMNALKMVIQDFETPPKKEFTRSLEANLKISVDHLQKCRPLAVSVTNAHKHIKHVLTQLPTDKPESELKEHLCHFIDTYIENQIGKAAEAISSSMQDKIKNGDVILTFGCSSLINYICEEAHRRHVDFRVIIVDSRPFCEGQELLRRLTAKEIPCTYVLINAVGFVMPEATKVLLGAHALLSNGYVMARTGTAQVALVANSFNVPVLVCCETHKFSERFQTDAIVYNELGDPHDLVLSDKCSLTNWQSKSKMSPLNLIYDITPPELVTAVVTEVSILPCTSVPVILRIKPTEIGYYS